MLLRITIILALLLTLIGCKTVPDFPEYLGEDAATLCSRTNISKYLNELQVSISSIDGVDAPNVNCNYPLTLEPKIYEVKLVHNFYSGKRGIVKVKLYPRKNYEIRTLLKDKHRGIYFVDRDTGQSRRMKFIKWY